MPNASQRSRIGSAPWRRSRQFVLVALTLLPFAGCFAEPKPETSTPSLSGSSGVGNTMSNSGGRRAQGGKSQAGSNSTNTGNDGTGDVMGLAGLQEPPGEGGNATGPDTTGGTQAVGSSAFKCHGAVAQPLPARKEVTSADVAPPTPPPTVLTVTREKLFTSFQHSCGVNSSCHVGSGDPNAQPQVAFKVTLDSFDARKTIGDEAMQHVTSSDPLQWMPPDGGSGAKRTKGNTYYDLADQLQQWQQKGFPESFNIPLDSSGPQQPVTNQRPYLLSPDLGNALTNIGNCVPTNLSDAAIMEDPVVAEMTQKDDLFAGLKTSDDLPDTIDQTDLVTLSSTDLAQRRVFSYAPTYPLYSDHAGKMRYVRVPLGESIHYDDKLHDFVIPDNTRFYKTFLKPVKDKDGNTGWRKMETRLIVVRQDSQNSDGSYTTHALRASYAWDKDEQQAHRVTDPFRDGTAARDRLCSYVVDESVPRDPTQNPISDQISDTCTYMTQDEIDDPKSGQIRHYAIPSTQRCDQCHMGSSSHSFILGFTPWQVDRRKSGEGGVYEDPNDDELTQLQRFLDYGIVDNVKPGQVKLEESQLIADPPRSPRNDYELTAQGYMMGNCAFCHNPHGFPVVTNPVLKEFELFPSETGGIFQFPLDKTSPRAKAGDTQATAIPYISAAFGDSTGSIADGKYQPMPVPQDPSTTPPTFALIDATSLNTPDVDPVAGTFTFLAPWRSLIWRNTYTPFTYTDHATLYIHMPRNVAGFDCRVAHIMAKWMLSIPVKNMPTPVQPVTEVPPDDPSQAFLYGQATLDAKQRVANYERGVSGLWCPEDDDIVDPKVILSLDPKTGVHSQTTPVDAGFPPGPRTNPAFDLTTAVARSAGDGVPDHAHWIPTDTTETPGKWIPRRPNWQDFIVKRDAPVSDQLSAIIDDLQQVHLTSDLENFALEPMPMGVWAPACQTTPEAQATPTAGELRADLVNHPGAPFSRWLLGQDFGGQKPSEGDHVHFQSRGEGVFRAICQNCHGSQIDSKSALAATIQELTGGQTRVANFIAGLFGPPSAPGAYAHDEFTIGDGLPYEDWHVRYVLFMGLGGTGATIPQSVLNLIATSPFYGHAVTIPGATSPNMLGSAQQFCYFVLANTRHLGDNGPELEEQGADFANGVGHYDLWESLCTTGNEPIVHVFTPVAGKLGYSSNSAYRAKDDTGLWLYPPTALVGNNAGTTDTGIQSSNLWPWCVAPGSDGDTSVIETWATQQGLSESQIPYCPAALFASVSNYPVYKLALDDIDHKEDPKPPFNNADFTGHWLRHGAFNSGISAFYFMRGFAEHTVTPDKTFDFCLQ
jgi:hypothetical protein